MKILLQKNILFYAFTLFAFTAEALIYSVNSEKNVVEFLAKGKPAIISIQGIGEKLSGTILHKDELLNGELEFDLSSLKTGISLRDDHMLNNYLEVNQYPKAKLIISKIPFNGQSPQKLDFKGLLLLHGVEKEISGKVEIEGDKSPTSFTAEFKLMLSDYQIKIPSFKGITVAEEVRVKVSSPITLQPE